MALPLRKGSAPGSARPVAQPGGYVTDLLLVLMALIWGVNFSVVKYGTRALDPLAYNGLRVLLAAVSLLAIAAAMGVPRPSRRDTLVLLALGVLGNGIYQMFFIEGIARTRAGDASLVLAASPAFIALMGHGMGVERLTRRRAAGISLSISGMALVVFGSAHAAGGQSSLVGNLLVLTGCLCWALFTVLLMPYAARTDGIRLAALTMAGGAVPLMLVAARPLAASEWDRVPPLAWAAVVYSGIGALVIAYLCWYRGMRVLGPTRTAMYSNLQPVIALLVAWATLHEVPTVLQGLGAVGILGGLVIARG
jgi:drug/metabolite transporter (DMT)-like permease